MSQSFGRYIWSAVTVDQSLGRLLMGRVSDYKLLTKPPIMLLVVVTAYIGFAMAAAGDWGWWTLIGLLVGTGLSCMGASVFNQVYERHTDALMPRTAERPLAARRLGVTEALVAGVVLSLAGLGVLWASTNWLAMAISAATILSYALVYTPLKRTTWLATMVGAVPGAAPPLIGAAAASGRVGVAGWLLFLILFLWQLPHFYAIAWLYKGDYAKAGLQMLPVVEEDGRRTFRHILVVCALLLVVGMLPYWLGLAGRLYFVAALVMGGVFSGLGIRLKLFPSRRAARAVFLWSLIYLPAVMGAMVIDGKG
jgi:protoheme IX farnesyltransferase